MRTAVIRIAVLGLWLSGVPGITEATTVEQSARPAERREIDKPMTDSTRRQGGNRLADATSPYLLQHKDNPVDWYAWGLEAFEAARRLDRPIFLSIGYSACHWCHVMEEESFEDPATAALMNEHFVNIKVDREERPDLDDIYMTSVQMLTGSGGWPMSVWLTPDLKPFYGGTYFPKESLYGRPSFRQILTALGEAWKNDRASLVGQADKIHESITQYLTGRRLPPGGAPPSRDLVARAVEEMSGSFDHVNGGFGGAPKFPPHRGLALMLARHRQTGDENLLRMATLTFDRMAAGGMYDQIGGGFHRYATDAAWQVPHFEKMLYDNALLSDAYLDAWETTGRDEYARIVREIGDWVLREMTGPQGGFYSTLDADSEGEEGLYYVWRPAQVIDLLGGEEGALVNEFYGITQQGNFEGGASIPHVDVPLPRFAERRKVSVPELARRLAAARGRLLAERDKRVRPHLDDKVLTAWNGLMIGALSRAGRALDERRYIEAAARAADFLMANARGEDGLMRVSWRAGRSRPESFLDDQAFLIQGLLALHEATGDPARLKQARALVAATDAAFWDPAEKGYYFALAGRSDLIVRAKSPTDSAIPSGNSAMAASLVRLQRLTGEASYGDRAGEIFQAFSGAMGAIPGAFH
ncbi:MAG TPA: thioredoxin domain-containing protein, partial [Candidatus Polarisedimenticolia bacterium]|nr:thioredoxin domain-containing protein [Candidatus Polarisedimenticolia bacterium]